MRVLAASLAGVALAGNRHGFAGPAHHMNAGGSAAAAEMPTGDMSHHMHPDDMTHHMPPHDPAMNVEGAHPMPHDMTMPEPYVPECHEGEVLCYEEMPTDCPDCMPYAFCMWGESCPPPPVMCDWETEWNCWEDDGTEWGYEFCASAETGCPLQCFENEIQCSTEWGESCVPMEDGCPPPMLECDWEFEQHCWEPNGTAYGHEFCFPNTEECPIICMENDMACADEWGEFCVPMDHGCPPPMTHCDWEFETMCWEDDGTYWGMNFCAPMDTGCPMMHYDDAATTHGFAKKHAHAKKGGRKKHAKKAGFANKKQRAHAKKGGRKKKGGN